MHGGMKPVRLSLALFIRANFSLICNTPRDGVFPDRVKIKITISDLHLRNTNVTDDGVENLQTALPDCEIFH